MSIFAVTLFADIYSNIDNLSVATDDGCISAGIIVVIFKAIIYQVNREKIVRVIRDVLKCADDLTEFSISDVDRIRDIIKSHYTFNKVISHGFNILGCVLVIALLFFSPTENNLPIRAKYPFNTTISPWHEIALGIEICAVSGGVLAILSMDSITVLLCNLIIMQFDILNVNFENCRRRVVNDTNRGCDEQCYKDFERHVEKTESSVFLSRYKTCIRFYQRLVSVTKDYNKTYSSSLFIQMLSSTSMICLTGFQVVVVGGQSSDVIKFGIYLSAAVSQIFYSCWIGNELIYSSSVLDRSQWLSDWHQEPLSDIVQVFTLSMMSARQSTQIKAGGFYVMSLQTFITIIRRSYSIFTLLNNMQVTNS
ncbi:PREDICTED: odorant receptor 13a-like [Dufourea novaeangliae]|uniref:odorant receptor 13a-like n=1 Tax=Dufourea novaeangliae TaxID=178035 RepID=UPI000766F43B|nr:PREDICTED: odorant receptor 13a-like [Dufourea novaeangliae]